LTFDADAVSRAASGTSVLPSVSFLVHLDGAASAASSQTPKPLLWSQMEHKQFLMDSNSNHNRMVSQLMVSQLMVSQLPMANSNSNRMVSQLLMANSNSNRTDSRLLKLRNRSNSSKLPWWLMVYFLS
jgi:hypothetical protein